MRYRLVVSNNGSADGFSVRSQLTSSRRRFSFFYELEASRRVLMWDSGGVIASLPDPGPSLTLEQLLTKARSRLHRITPLELALAMQRHEAIVLDTRTPSDRALYRCIPGALHTPRTVLEWRVALDAPLKLPEITSHDQLLVVVCNEGFSSGLAAMTLQQLGFHRATDLIGGVMAWREAGLPLVDAVGDEIGIQIDT